MGALRTKNVRVYQHGAGAVHEGSVSYEGDNYVMLIDADGVTHVFPWASISRLEVIRNN